MMSGNVSVTVQYNHFPTIAEKLGPTIMMRLDKGLATILQNAQADIHPVTGSLRASGYRITPVVNTYAAAVSAMQARNPRVKATEPPAAEKNAAFLGFAAEHAIYVHEGHHTRSGSFVAARPFLRNAFAAGRAELIKIATEAIKEACQVK